ncbi:MAG: carboxypeptidase-like regulatory domain-containing protein [Patescibacteria group bacterium]|nr:carboxypeptidase-like regulatory domain-containing protein [Patescibacteria group bacterium]
MNIPSLAISNIFRGTLPVVVTFFFLYAVTPVLAGNVPNKRVCLVNDKGVPINYNGQGLWVTHNNATGSKWTGQTDAATGCVDFQADESTMDARFPPGVQADTDFDGRPDTPRRTDAGGGNGDLGCASGPFGFKVHLPKDWENTWECQSVGTPNGPFPCCRSQEERDNPDLRPAGGCNDCKAHASGYEGEYTEKLCYCDRSTHNNLPDSECPICFHNDGVQVNVRLECRSKKQTSSRNLDKPQIQQFNPREGINLACLPADVCKAEGAAADSGGAECSKKTPANSLTRRVKLYRVKNLKQQLSMLDASKPVFLVECVMEGTDETNASYRCTTGDSALDLQNGLTTDGKPNFQHLKDLYGYTATLYTAEGTRRVGSIDLVQPLLDDSVVLDEYEWETTTTKPTSSVFMLMYDEQNANAALSGDKTSQKQSKLSFVENCTLIIDPYGRVFDRVTLEPLSDADLVVLTKEASPDSRPIARQTTREDGVFSFLLQPGTYRMTVARPGYTFPAFLEPREGYKPAYENLHRGEPFTVQDRLLLFDVPMEPANSGVSIKYARANKPKLMEHFQSIGKAGETYRVQGRVSHSRSLVAVYAGIFRNGEIVRGRRISYTQADGYGRFTLEFPLSVLNRNETIYGIKITKNSKIFRIQGAEESFTRIDPVLHEIVGTAFDSSGNRLPGATVKIRIPHAETPYRTVIADREGRFRIAAEDLPPVGYSLEYETLSGVRKSIDTGQFLAQNVAAGIQPGRYFAAVPPEDTVVAGVSDDYQSSRQFRPDVWHLFAVFVPFSSALLYHVYLRKRKRKR